MANQNFKTKSIRSFLEEFFAELLIAVNRYPFYKYLSD